MFEEKTRNEDTFSQPDDATGVNERVPCVRVPVRPCLCCLLFNLSATARCWKLLALLTRLGRKRDCVDPPWLTVVSGFTRDGTGSTNRAELCLRVGSWAEFLTDDEATSPPYVITQPPRRTLLAGAKKHNSISPLYDPVSRVTFTLHVGEGIVCIGLWREKQLAGKGRQTSPRSNNR